MTLGLTRIDLAPDERLTEAQLDRHGATNPDAEEAARLIISEVRERGDAVLFELGEKFDGASLTALRVPQAELEQALASLDPGLLAALELAAERIRSFHEEERVSSWFTTREDGTILGQKVTPLDAAGIYVPGGRAQYPSTVLMNAIPAQVAGVERIVMCTPAGPSGLPSQATLAAAALVGVDEVYLVGGAQAIAALAYGTESIAPVDKITGPGNAYVAAAKKLVMGDVGIDMIAGPSEVCVLADGTADPTVVAMDLMAQAEHDPLATSYLVTTDAALADAVQSELERLLQGSPREEVTRLSLQDNGMIVVCPDRDQAIAAVDTIAPEHLEIQTADALGDMSRVKHAGAIFVGRWSSEALGDYVAGPNHTLPTGGTARFSGPLSTSDFTKVSSVIIYTEEGFRADAPAVRAIADAEGLWSHGMSTTVREEARS